MKKREIHIPKAAAWFFQNLAEAEDAVPLTGDVEEDYKDILSEGGDFRAKCWIWYQVLISLPSFLRSYLYWRSVMLKKLFKDRIPDNQKT